MFTLQAMDWDTPCTLTLLVVERSTPCTSVVHTAGGGKGYTLHVHTDAVERDTPCTVHIHTTGAVVERNTTFTSILLAVEGDTPCIRP